ncbi:hypothetical protein M8494_24785 [Serratia ureilytica]
MFIGPADLSADMGFAGVAAPGGAAHHRRRDCAHPRRRQRRGILMANKALAQRYLEAGALFVAVGWTPPPAGARRRKPWLTRFKRAGVQAQLSGVY